MCPSTRSSLREAGSSRSPPPHTPPPTLLSYLGSTLWYIPPDPSWKNAIAKLPRIRPFLPPPKKPHEHSVTHSDVPKKLAAPKPSLRSSTPTTRSDYSPHLQSSVPQSAKVGTRYCLPPLRPCPRRPRPRLSRPSLHSKPLVTSRPPASAPPRSPR